MNIIISTMNLIIDGKAGHVYHCWTSTWPLLEVTTGSLPQKQLKIYESAPSSGVIMERSVTDVVACIVSTSNIED